MGGHIEGRARQRLRMMERQRDPARLSFNRPRGADDRQHRELSVPDCSRALCILFELTYDNIGLDTPGPKFIDHDTILHT